jgi:GNAT superfamily N-acetyltransferase
MPDRVLVRELAAGAADRAAVDALVRSCFPSTLARRFFLRSAADPGLVLGRYGQYLMPQPPISAALLAEVDGLPAGLLNLVAGPDQALELGVLVADPWRRRGIGTALARAAGDPTRWWAGRPMRATLEGDNGAARALLRRVAPERRLLDAACGELEYAVEIHGARSGRAHRRSRSTDSRSRYSRSSISPRANRSASTDSPAERACPRHRRRTPNTTATSTVSQNSPHTSGTTGHQNPPAPGPCG